MVKGISKRVIVVHSPDPKLFDQAIFILKNDVVSKEGITDEALLKEAQRIVTGPGKTHKRGMALIGPLWALLGAALTGIAWGISAFL